MRSPNGFRDLALLAKDWRVLRHSRAWLLVALAIGPLVGMAWREAVATYMEMSGTPGDAAALTSALSPLDGLVSPLFGAYAVVATLLLPFVAIRTVAAEKASGAQSLLLHVEVPVWRQVLWRFVALVGTWLLWLTPGLLGLAIWSTRGGHLYAPETLGVIGGHLMRGALVAALGIASAAITESAASAAVVALAVTLGGWAVDFTATVRGGLAASLAPFTPDAMLRTFEHGLIAFDEAAVALLLIAGLLGLAVVWLEPARTRRNALLYSLLLTAGLAVTLPLASRVRRAVDLSEDRRNSFSPADERALGTIAAPLSITVHMGPSDPRRTDLEFGVLRKLERAMPIVNITYAAQSSTGLFAGNEEHYGEVWYDLGGELRMSKSTTPAIVLETIYDLAHLPLPAGDAAVYPGYPARLRATTLELALAFVAWPAFVLAAWVWRREPKRSRPLHRPAPSLTV